MQETHSVQIVLPTGRTVDASLTFERRSDDSYRVSIDYESDGNARGEGSDLYVALREARRSLDASGVKLLCNGSRPNVRPSGMGSQMSGGRKACAHTLGRATSMEDLRDILAPAPAEEVGTVEEQTAFFIEWKRSLGV